MVQDDLGQDRKRSMVSLLVFGWLAVVDHLFDMLVPY
jgi:hypothetical protein